MFCSANQVARAYQRYAACRFAGFSAGLALFTGRNKYGDLGTRKIPKVIGAEKILPVRHVMSMPGDGGFTVLMCNFINSLLDGEAVMNGHTGETSDLAKTSL